ncbi:MAG: FHA domain-containing protein [Proteobacteria bacterium]|nr:FHA domain-containing protein [Pseudomonadota bacterium]
MFRSLLVDNPLRFFFNPLLGALGGLAGWALFLLTLDIIAEVEALHGAAEMIERVSYFAFMGLCVAFAINLLKGIQDGQGAMRVFGQGLMAGIVGGFGGLLGGLAIHLAAELAGTTMDSVGPRVAAYLLVGTLVGLSSRITSLDKTTALAAIGGFLGGLFAVLFWIAAEKIGGSADAYATLLIPMTLGFGIGAATYSLPSFISGGTLRVLTGQFRGQTKAIEGDDIVVGNNKRQLQWVLPKWEGVQDPHAKIEVKAEGKGYKHSVRNMSSKAVVVVRDKKRHRIKTKATMELEDGDILVFATGKNYVKVKYIQKTEKS